MPGSLDSCINNIYEDGNIGASSGTTPVRVYLHDPGSGTGMAAGVGTAAAVGTVGTGGDPNWTNVKLLMGFEGSDAATGTPGMDDESSAAHGTATVNGNAQIDTTDFIVGTSSLLVDGSGDTIQFADSADWDLSNANSDQFTIEAKIRPVSGTITNAMIVGQYGGVGALGFYILINADTLNFVAGNTVSTFDIVMTASGITWVAGTVYDIAVDKDSGGKIRVYLNGAMVANATPANSAFADPSQILTIGGSDSSFYFNGRIDELRITKGTARYASDSGYTPSATAFPRS